MSDTISVKASLNLNDTPANIPHWVAGVNEINFQKQLRSSQPIVYYSSPEIHRPASEPVLNYLIANAPPPTPPPNAEQNRLLRAELEEATRTELPASTSTFTDNSGESAENVGGAVGDRLIEEFEGAIGGRSTEELGGAVGGVSNPISNQSEAEVHGILELLASTDFWPAFGGNLGTEVELEDEVFVDPALPQVRPTSNIPPLQVQQVVPPVTIQVTVTQPLPTQTIPAQHLVAPVTTQVINPQLLPTRG